MTLLVGFEAALSNARRRESVSPDLQGALHNARLDGVSAGDSHDAKE